MKTHLPLLVLLAVALLPLALGAEPTSGPLEFHDVEKQTLEFVGYYESIDMSAEQMAVRQAALEPLPAACCSDKSAATCCCECNMSRSVWGLSNFLIAEHGADAETVRAAVEEWVEFINPEGFPGDTCYSPGGCMKAFKNDGCGGMRADRVVFD